MRSVKNQATLYIIVMYSSTVPTSLEVDVSKLKLEQELKDLLDLLEEVLEVKSSAIPWVKDLGKIIDALKRWNPSDGSRPPSIDNPYSGYGKAYNFVLGYSDRALWSNEQFSRAILVLAPLCVEFCSDSEKDSFLHQFLSRPEVSGNDLVVKILNTYAKGHQLTESIVQRAISEFGSQNSLRYLGYLSLLQHKILSDADSRFSVRDKYYFSIILTKLYQSFERTRLLLLKRREVAEFGADELFGVVTAAIVSLRVSLLGIPYVFAVDVYKIFTSDSVRLLNIVLSTAGSDQDAAKEILYADSVFKVWAAFLRFIWKQFKKFDNIRELILRLLGGVGLPSVSLIGLLKACPWILPHLLFFAAGILLGVSLLAYYVAVRVRKIRSILERSFALYREQSKNFLF